MDNLVISIVVYREDYGRLKGLLSGLLDYSKDFKFSIHVLDNSPVNCADTFKKDFPEIIYTFNNANLGYGKAHNIAIKRSVENNVKYHLALNPDVIIEKGTLEALYGYMEKDPDTGLVMPRVVYPDGTMQYLCKLLPTPADLIIRRFFPQKWGWVDRQKQRYELKGTGYDKVMNVPSLSGCFMFMRTSVLRELGGFDERFFMYLEDVDLSRRIHSRYKTLYYPDVKIIHEHRKGSYTSRGLMGCHVLSAIRYFNKWGWVFDAERKKINRRAFFRVS